MRDFNLSEKIWLTETRGRKEQLGYGQHILTANDVKEFIRLLKEKINEARMYADMTEDIFWGTSTISPEQAEFRAKYLEEFGEEINKLAGDRLSNEKEVKN